jgi:hypothetical protein
MNSRSLVFLRSRMAHAPGWRGLVWVERRPADLPASTYM